MKTGYGDGLFYLARFWHGGYKLGLKLEYSSTSILNSVDGLSSTLAGKHLKHRRACREGGENMSSIYGSWIPCEAFRALQDHYRMGRALAMREDMHIHFKQAAQCLRIPESSLRQRVANRFPNTSSFSNSRGARRWPSAGSALCGHCAGTVPDQYPRRISPREHLCLVKGTLQEESG